MKKLMVLSLLMPSLSFAAGPAVSNSAPYFFGEINSESVKSFIHKYDERADIKELVINSQGGDVEAGIRFGNWVFKKGLDVTVPALCFSACANYVFIAGKRKVLKPGAFVAWHGDVEQKDFRELVEKYENIVSKKKAAKQSNDEDLFLRNNQKNYESLVGLRKRLSDFYALLNVNAEFGRAGQEPVDYPSDGWTLTKKAMEHFGIANVEVPGDYGTVEYFSLVPGAVLINKGPLLILDVDNSGKLFPVNLEQVSSRK